MAIARTSSGISLVTKQTKTTKGYDCANCINYIGVYPSCSIGNNPKYGMEKVGLGYDDWVVTEAPCLDFKEIEK
jgi:hypothetical protein